MPGRHRRWGIRPTRRADGTPTVAAVDIPMIAGTVAIVVFAVSNLPMLRKAMRTRDVSSYSLSSVAMINAANVLYSLYVFSLPGGPMWALHAFYVVSCAIMLVLCLGRRRAADVRRERSPFVDGAGHEPSRVDAPRARV
jgi:uncharacterized protein with PQ loop repeat